MLPLLLYAFHHFQRFNGFNKILRGGCLSQQHDVDQFYQVKSERLQYLHQSQVFIRAADDKSICEQQEDPGSAENEVDAVRAGRFFILLTIYVGCDRYMRHSMYIITCISNNVRYPDILLTTTCNSQWRELKDTLLPEQSVIGCLDITARIFRTILRALMDVLVGEQIFGEAKAHV